MNRLLLIALLVLSGCSSVKKDTKRVYKIHYRNQIVLDKYCAENRPCTDSFSEVTKYVHGEDIVYVDTVVVHDTLDGTDIDVGTITKYIYKTIKTVDTLYKETNEKQTDKKVLALKDAEITKLEAQIIERIKLEEKLFAKLHNRTMELWVWRGLLIAFVLFRVLKAYFFKR